MTTMMTSRDGLNERVYVDSHTDIEKIASENSQFEILAAYIMNETNCMPDRALEVAYLIMDDVDHSIDAWQGKEDEDDAD